MICVTKWIGWWLKNFCFSISYLVGNGLRGRPSCLSILALYLKSWWMSLLSGWLGAMMWWAMRIQNFFKWHSGKIWFHVAKTTWLPVTWNGRDDSTRDKNGESQWCLPIKSHREGGGGRQNKQMVQSWARCLLIRKTSIYSHILQ